MDSKQHLIKHSHRNLSRARRRSMKDLDRAAAYVTGIGSMAAEAGNLVATGQLGADDVARLERLLQAIHYQSQDLEQRMAAVAAGLHELALPVPEDV